MPKKQETKGARKSEPNQNENIQKSSLGDADPKILGRDKGDSAFVFGADKGRKQISGSRFTPLESDSGDMVTDSSAKTQDLDLIVNKMKSIPGPSNKLPQASKQLFKFKAGVSGQTSDGSKAKQAKGAMGQGLGSSKAQLSKSKKSSPASSSTKTQL